MIKYDLPLVCARERDSFYRLSLPRDQIMNQSECLLLCPANQSLLNSFFDNSCRKHHHLSTPFLGFYEVYIFDADFNDSTL